MADFVKGTFSAEARRVADEFFAYKKEHPEKIPFEQLTPLQQRMQVEGEIQEYGNVTPETAAAMDRIKKLHTPEA